MKKIALSIVGLSCVLLGFSQTNHQLQPFNQPIKFTPKTNSTPVFKKGLTNCTVDTLDYCQAKATGLQGISINNATSAQAVSQYFTTPQDITVDGANFYAYSLAGFSVNVTVDLYLAGIDSLPTGAPLASTTVVVDTNFYGGNFPQLIKKGTFSVPVTVNQPYVIVVGNYSANNIALMCNDYTVQDGQQEWLAGIDLAGTWLPSYNVNVGGTPFDADWLIEPKVSYDLTADFIPSQMSINTVPDTIQFTDNSSLVLKDKMYNQTAFFNLTELSYTYNFGDGSPTENVIDTNHVYASLQTYSVTLTDTIYGWRNNCVASETKLITYTTPDLVISEIMYNPPESGTDSLEFIEIYNNDTFAVDLTNYSFSQGVVYTFPNDTLNPGEYYVIAINSIAFNNVFGFVPNGQFTNGLSNGGEDVTLVDANGMMIDSVDYDNSAPWPSGMATGEPNGGGASLVLCDVNADNNDGNNWNASVSGTGVVINGREVLASPGAANFCCPILSGTDTQVVCDSLVWMDGNTYYSDNTTAIYITQNTQGCDSTITLNLTVNTSPTVTITEPASTMLSANCFGTEFVMLASGADTYVWDDLSTYDTLVYVADTANMWFTLSVTGTDTLTGCSTVGTFNIPGVYDPVTPGSQTLTICNGEDVTVGSNTYNATGTYTDTLMSVVNGCDSVVTTDLTVEPAIDITVSNTSPTLTANQGGASYQWLDCDNGNAVIPTETGQSYTATVNGNYAVEITVGSCVDTSACENVTGVGVSELTTQEVLVYPNPTSGIITIDLGENTHLVEYSMTTLEGRIVKQGRTTDNKIVVNLSEESSGIYFLKLGNSVYKVMKQ